MITCNRCGKPIPAGLTNCQYCGMPVSRMENVGNVGGYGAGSRMGAPEQPELPAWLESLHVEDRVEPSSGSPINFSASDLVDDGVLPRWMLSDTSASVERMQAQQPQPQNIRPATRPAPNTDSSQLPAQKLTAGSLIDQSFLPSWMQEEKQTSSPQNISAASLIQPNVLPEWMRTNQPQQPPAASVPRPPQPQPQPPTVAPTTPPRGFLANNLIEQGTLPPWMFEQAGAPSPTTGQGQERFSASSLLDSQSLPQWMVENNQGMATGPQNGNTGMNQGGFYAAPPPMPGQNTNSMSASSFIDPQALPEWLRNQGDPSAMGQSGYTRTGQYGVPPRNDNMRVPNRPRNEIERHEDSAAAANVFASMLGVASNAPSLPMQPPAYQANPSQQQPPMGMPYSGYGVAGQTNGFGAGQNAIPDGYPGGNPSWGAPGAQQPQDVQQKTTTNPSSAKPAKRGFLDTVRDWFSR